MGIADPQHSSSAPYDERPLLHDMKGGAVPLERLNIERLGEHVGVILRRVQSVELPVVLFKVVVDETNGELLVW